MLARALAGRDLAVVHRRHENLDTAMPPDALLVDHDLVTAFEVGWSVLYQDVSLFVADQLMSTLADLHVSMPTLATNCARCGASSRSSARPAHRGSHAAPPRCSRCST